MSPREERIELTSRADGGYILRSAEPLKSHAKLAGDTLLDWAARAPARTAMADRRTPGRDWRTVSYAELARLTARAGHAMLHPKRRPETSVLLLSANRIEAAIAILGAYRSGRVIAPVTPAYAAGGDIGRLQAVVEALRPGLVIVDDLAPYAEALRKALPNEVAIVSMAPAGGALDWAAFLAEAEGDAAPFPPLSPDRAAKVLFTSGATGAPKGVITTHRMLTSNQQAIAQTLPIPPGPPVLLDWLPWSHTFGGSYVFGLALTQGGSLYIDDGRPASGQLAPTLEALRAVRPTLHFNVPRGLDLLAEALEHDSGLAAEVFETLQTVFFAGAGLPARIRDRWRRLIDRHARKQVHFCSAWGLTETAPLATALNWNAREPNNIGVPAPGVEIKLAPADGCYELRVRGPNVTPGYLGDPQASIELFDADGFLKTGDCAVLADPADPGAGLLYEGRLAENFKLTSGVWVHVAELRDRLLNALGPAVREVVVSGAGRRSLGLLIVLDPEAAARELGLAGDHAALAAAPQLHRHIRERLAAYNAANPASSRRIEGFNILGRGLDPGAGEATEKGTVNQRAVLRREAALCAALHERIDAEAVPA